MPNGLVCRVHNHFRGARDPCRAPSCAHQLPKMSDSRKNQGAGAAHCFRGGHALADDMLSRERALHRRQIAGVIFDKRNFHKCALIKRS